MKTPLIEIGRLIARGALGLSLGLSGINRSSAQEDPVSIDDIRFASQVGTHLQPIFNQPSTLPPLRTPDFRGTTGRSCGTLDLDTFLRQFDPHELLTEMRQSLLSGAQSEISNYLVALAYSAPTLASVLDMTDRQLHARFMAFAQTCSNQQSRSIDLQETRRLAQASDQCYSREISRGTAPTDAYRRCALSRSFDSLALPATLTTLEFLRQHSDLLVTPRIQSLLDLLPDERIVAGNYQVHSPKITLDALSNALQVRSGQALNQIIHGVPAASMTECRVESILNPGGSACLPRSALGIVNTPAFRGARLLPPSALSIFKDALSGQIAATAVYSDLLELTQQIAGLDLRPGSDASASEMLSRKRILQDHLGQLLKQADLRFKLQRSRSQLARTQLLALERVHADLQARAEVLQGQSTPPALSVIDLLQLFRNRD